MPFELASLSDLPAFGIGHAHDRKHATGCTAIVAPEGAVCGVDVRGGGPATRETDLLKPENMVELVHAVMLSGGSAFGLEASCGAMEALADAGCGFELAGLHVPIVVGACLFDLPYGEMAKGGRPAFPDKAMGRAACEAALENRRQNNADIAWGNVGAGTGATVGKLLGADRAMKSGIGSFVLRAGEIVVGAIVAVNALGNVHAPDGTPLAGCRAEDGGIIDAIEAARMALSAATSAPICENTTIGCILTNAKLTKAQATKTASVSHDAYARAIKPVHTQNDGDSIFCFASGDVEAPGDLVSVLATEAMQRAVIEAVRSADAAYGLPAAESRCAR